MYDRENPSPEYREMIEMYETLHNEGEQTEGKTAEETFPGKMLIKHAPFIKDVIDRIGANSILDYGAGKGLRCYDPGYEPFSKLPSEQFDAVICTDVLEHITEPDVPWVLEEMFSYARNFVYANVACFPAVKFLPNGQNVHCTIHPPDWWAGVVHAVAMRHPEISYHLVMTTKTGPYKKFGFAKNRRSVHHTVERIA